MVDREKTREQLLEEVGALRRKLSELEAKPSFDLCSGDRYRQVLGNMTEGFAMCEPVLDASGYLGRFVSVSGDVTGNNPVAEALRQSEQRLALALKAGGSGTFDWDAKTDVNLWSHELLALYGLEPGEFGGRYEDWVECLVPEDREAGAAAVKKSLETGEFEIEFRIRRQDTGEVRWMYGCAQVFFDSSGQPTRMIGINVDITRRKQAEEALRESEEQLHLIIDSLPVLVSFIDSDHRHRFSNKTYNEWFGEDDISGKHMREVFGEDTYRALLPRIETALSGRTVTFEQELPYRDGGIRYVNKSYIPHRDREGHTKGFVVLVQDMTEHKQALREIESTARFPGENPNPVLRTSAEGVLLYANASSSHMLESLRWTVGGRLPGNWRRLMAEAMELGTPMDIEVECGPTVYLLTLTPVSSSGYINLYGKDITERKSLERMLRESELRAVAAFELSAVGQAEVDSTTGRFIRVNQKLCEITGYSRDELLAMTFSEVSHPDDRDADRIAYRKALSGEAPEYVSQKRYLRKDGSIRWVEVHAAILRDGDGSPLRSIGVIQDITERKLAEERLRKENREAALANRILEVFVKEGGDDLYDKTLDIVLEAMESRHGVFGYIDEQDDLICPTMSKLLDQCEIEGKCICYTSDKWKGLWSRAMLDQTTLYTNREAKIPLGHVPICNNIAVPIVFQGKAIGLFNLANKETGYTEGDREFIDAVAARIAPVLYARIQVEMREKERRRSMDALRESEERLLALVQASSDVVYRMSPDWSEMRQLIGRNFIPDVEDPSSTWLQRYIHPEDQPQVTTVINEAIWNKTVFELEHRVLRVDGSLGWTFSRAIPLLDENGEITEWFGAASDVTARKQAEEALRVKEAELQLVADATPIVLARLSRDLRYVFVNRACAQMFGRPAEEIIGKPIPEIIGREAFETIRPYVESVLRGEKVEYEIEIPYKGIGTRFEFVTYVPERDGKGEVTGWIASVFDITERRQAEEKIKNQKAILETINLIFQKALTCETDEQLGDACLTVVEDLTESKFSFIGEIGSDGLLHDLAISNPGWELCKMYDKSGHRRPPGDFKPPGLYGRVLLDGKSLLTNDPYSHPHSIGTPAGHPRLTTFLGVPLKREGKTIGIVALGNREGGYTQEHQHMVEAIAPAIVQALLRKRAEEALRKAHYELELRVEERTAELEMVNQKLTVEVEERKKALETVKAERQRFYDVLETLPVYICLLKPDYHVSFVNRVFREHFGESEEGLRCFEFLFGRNEPCEVCETYKVLEDMAPRQWEWTGPNHHLYSVFDFPFTETDGSTLILEMGIDITERKKAETELRAYARRLEMVNQELQEFAFIASHDLQEPLRKIQTFGSMLRARCEGQLSEQGKDYLIRMENSATRMRQLIQDLLQFSRVATRPEPYKPVDLKETLDEVISVFEHQIAQERASIEISDLPIIDADRTRMSQLFQNLVGNALKYRKENEPLSIRIYTDSQDRRFVKILVEDNGIGFEEQFVGKIFTPFQRLHTKGTYEGTGMGLAICRKIVEQHGGSIAARSVPGKGSTFIIDLPIRQIEQRG